MLQVDVCERVVYDWNCPNCRHENQTEVDSEVVCDRCEKTYQPVVNA